MVNAVLRHAYVEVNGVRLHFQRELRENPAQQRASRYMHLCVRVTPTGR